jgi:hypothetical protein
VLYYGIEARGRVSQSNRTDGAVGSVRVRPAKYRGDVEMLRDHTSLSAPAGRTHQPPSRVTTQQKKMCRKKKQRRSPACVPPCTAPPRSSVRGWLAPGCVAGTPPACGACAAAPPTPSSLSEHQAHQGPPVRSRGARGPSAP